MWPFSLSAFGDINTWTVVAPPALFTLFLQGQRKSSYHFSIIFSSHTKVYETSQRCEMHSILWSSNQRRETGFLFGFQTTLFSTSTTTSSSPCLLVILQRHNFSTPAYGKRLSWGDDNNDRPWRGGGGKDHPRCPRISRSTSNRSPRCVFSTELVCKQYFDAISYLCVCIFLRSLVPFATFCFLSYYSCPFF